MCICEERGEWQGTGEWRMCVCGGEGGLERKREGGRKQREGKASLNNVFTPGTASKQELQNVIMKHRFYI